jgi:DNA sulfur modification protein DndC
MKEATTLPLKQRSVADFIEDVNKLTIEIQELYCSDRIPWILGVSYSLSGMRSLHYH